MTSTPIPRSVLGASMVLIADDDAMLRRLYVRLLGSRFRLILASDGWEALRLAREQSPAVAILDVQMPGLTGIEVATQLQEWPDPPQILLVSGTFAGVANPHHPAIPSGVLACLPKPVDAALLFGWVEVAVSAAKLGSKKP